MTTSETKKHLMLDNHGGHMRPKYEIAAAIASDLNQRGILSARVYEQTYYGVEVDAGEWLAAKQANKERIDAKEAAYRAEQFAKLDELQSRKKGRTK